MRVSHAYFTIMLTYAALLCEQGATWMQQPKRPYNEWLSLEDCTLLESIGGTPGPMLGCRGSHYSHEICCHGLTKPYEPILYGSTLAFEGLHDDTAAEPGPVTKEAARADTVAALTSEQIVLKRIDAMNKEMLKGFKAIRDDLLYGRR